MLEFADLSRAVVGLGVVILLMVVVFWLLRRFGPHGGGGRGPGRRLALVESLPLDPRTRLVLVRHDDKEHLIVLATSGTATVLPAAGMANPNDDRGEPA